MNIRQKYLEDNIRLIKEHLMLHDGYYEKSIYLKKDKDIIGLHAEYSLDGDGGPQLMNAWANAYSNQYKFLGSVYRIFGPIEEEAEAMKADGWVEIPPPEDPTPPLPEAA